MPWRETSQKFTGVVGVSMREGATVLRGSACIWANGNGGTGDSDGVDSNRGGGGVDERGSHSSTWVCM